MRQVCQTHGPVPLPRERDLARVVQVDWVGARARLEVCGKSRPSDIRSPDRSDRSEPV